MDIERTMEFIVENLAAVTVRQQKIEEGLAALAERWLDSMNKGANGHKKRSGS